MSIATTSRGVSGAVRDHTGQAVSIRLRASTATVPAPTSASGAARPPMAPAASIARPGSMRSKVLLLVSLWKVKKQVKGRKIKELKTMKNNYPNEIVAHECGHWFALAAAGLAGDFTLATVVRQGGVYGRTERSEESLTKYSLDLASCAGKMGNPTSVEAGMADFRNCIKRAPEACLPHICFFLGGGSVDRQLGRESTLRNSIDTNCVKTMVVPAMAVPSISDTEFKEVQAKVDEFLWAAFKREELLFAEMYELLSSRQTVTAADVNPQLAGKLKECAERSRDGYQRLLAWFREWHGPKVSQFG